MWDARWRPAAQEKISTTFNRCSLGKKKPRRLAVNSHCHLKRIVCFSGCKSTSGEIECTNGSDVAVRGRDVPTRCDLSFPYKAPVNVVDLQLGSAQLSRHNDPLRSSSPTSTLMQSKGVSRTLCRLEVVWSMWRMGNMMRGQSATNKVSEGNRENSSKGSEDDMGVVLQDYPAPEISEPIFRMGDKLRLVTREAYWWRVRSVQTGKENYIPKSHVARVYHGWLFEGVERQKAEELLLLPVNRVGSFLVRESSRERGLYSLSVKHRMVKHYRILRLGNSWYYISPRLTFQCLEDLINHYSDVADGLCCALTSPCLSSTMPPSDANQGAPPVVMRHNFDWEKVDKNQLVSTDTCGDNVVSYGVRNSIAAYLSFSADQQADLRAASRKKKSKSVCLVPAHDGYEDDF